MSGKSRIIAKLLKHKKEIFSATFARIIYSLPKGTLHLKTEYLSELRGYVENLEVIESVPSFPSIGLDLDPQFPKLLIVEDQQARGVSSI